MTVSWDCRAPGSGAGETALSPRGAWPKRRGNRVIAPTARTQAPYSYYPGLTTLTGRLWSPLSRASLLPAQPVCWNQIRGLALKPFEVREGRYFVAVPAPLAVPLNNPRRAY